MNDSKDDEKNIYSCKKYLHKIPRLIPEARQGNLTFAINIGTFFAYCWAGEKKCNPFKTQVFKGKSMKR